jgi:hypothetical protein
MERTVKIWFETNDWQVLKQSLACLPPELKIYEYCIDETTCSELKKYTCKWYFNEPDWNLLVPLKHFLLQEGWEIHEHFIPPEFSETEKHSGQLFNLSTIVFRWQSETEAPPVIERNCPHCHRQHSYLLKNPHLYLSISIENRPKLFYSRSGLWVMAIELRDSLVERGLATGLCWYPVTVEEDEQQQYVGIYSNINIGWPVAPYGSYTPGSKPCPVCGSVYPKYNFYDIFNRPPAPAHWMWRHPFGPTSPLISGDVANWMWSQWLEGQTDELENPQSNTNLGTWRRERKEWLKQREKLPLTVPPSPHERRKVWEVEDFSLTRHGWYPDEAEQAFLPPQYHLEINQPDEEPEPRSIRETPPFLAGTNIPENASTCRIDGEIIISYYTSEYDFWDSTLVFIYENNQVVDCRLRLKVADWDLYLYMEDEGETFNLLKYLKTPMFGGDFVPEKELELELRLSPDLLPHLLRHAQTVDEAAAFIVKLSQEKPKHPLIGGENWFCTWVKQYIELEPAGQAWEAIAPWHSTFWHHISLSDLTMGEADSEQFARRLTDKYLQWVEAGNGRTQEDVKKLREEGTDGNFEAISLDIQEAVTEFENIDGEIYAAALRFFIEQGFPIDPYQDGDFFWFDFQGKNGKWRCRAEMNEKNQEFCFYSRYVDDVPENKRIDMAQFLTRANHYLSLGNFDLDWGYQTLSYKTSIRLPGIWSQENPLNQELLKQLVYTNLETMDQHWSAIQAILEKDVAPDEALDLIED